MEEKYNLFNPHPSEIQKYTYRDMLECWIAGRENIVRHGINDACDKPDFSSWMKEYFSKNYEISHPQSQK